MGTLRRSDLVPHFTVTALDGRRVAYADLWQHRALVLIAVPEPAGDAAAAYVGSLLASAPRLRSLGGELVVTTDAVPGVPRPGAIVADRWGEVYFVAEGSTVADLPSDEDLADWLEHIRDECPECQGEAR